ncbi:MAG TPA: CpaD family pilus assembly lipoprotein [Micavibrio sp.]
MQGHRTAILGFAAMVLLSGCGAVMHSPTQITTDRAEVYRDQFTLDSRTDSLGNSQIVDISRQYASVGDGPLYVTVTYDPHSTSNTAMRATQESQRLTGLLRKNGVKQVEADIIPVRDGGDLSRTLIAYDALHARPPSSCGEPMSMEFSDIDATQDYKLGCSVETYTARQIARPRDLLGRDDMGNSDGRPRVNGIEPYMSGAPNKELGGEKASE